MSKSAADRVIDDPANHYPYRRNDAVKAGWPKVLADASARVVEAQEAYLRNPSEETLRERNEAESEAQRLSSEHRTDRLRYALEQQIKDLEGGGRGAHISVDSGSPAEGGAE